MTHTIMTNIAFDDNQARTDALTDIDFELGHTQQHTVEYDCGRAIGMTQVYFDLGIITKSDYDFFWEEIQKWRREG